MKVQLYQPQAIHELGKRKNQEDTIYPVKGEATEQNRVFLVCDGMGGHDKGEVASAAVCKGISEAAEAHLAKNRLFTKDDFMYALDHAYDVVDEADVTNEGAMGTTMTFLIFHQGGCLAAYIGDSRIYHLRPSTGEVLYRSRDHSLVQQLYDLGELSYDEMKTSPRKNVILKAVQPHQDQRTLPSFVQIKDICPGDYFYMCSDGMLEDMEDDELMAVVGSELSDEEKAAELIRRTTDNSDNHSAYLIRVKEVVAEEGDEAFPSDEEEQRKKNKALNDNSKDVAWYTIPPSGQKAEDPIAGAPATEVSANSAVNNGGSRKILMWLLPLLFLAIGVALFLFLGGKNDKAANDDEEDSTKPRQENTSGNIIPIHQDDDRPGVKADLRDPKPIPSPSEDELVDYVIHGPEAPSSNSAAQEPPVTGGNEEGVTTGVKQD